MSDYHEMNILVVDDDLSTREKIQSDLRSLGFTGTLHEAVDGEDALRTLSALEMKNAKLDLVICDIVMPKKTGVEFLQDLRGGQSRYKNIKFLMLSSQSDRALVVACVKLGVGQYLIKPWDQKSLMLKMMEINKS